jgi:fluoride exporter
MRQILLITVFGALGSLARHGMGLLARHHFGKSFPFETLIVNVLGCFIIGFIAYGNLSEKMDETMKTALIVGFLGAFTTFSAFGYATFEFLRQGQWHYAAANAGLNFAVGLLAVWAGMMIGQALP